MTRARARPLAAGTRGWAPGGVRVIEGGDRRPSLDRRGGRELRESLYGPLGE